MTIEERNIKLKHYITCMKCEASGKVCDENCPTQYEAGNIGEIIENLEAISEILEQQPCEDAVSRQAVIKLLSYDWANRPAHKAVESVRNLPSATPKEKTGWIPVSEGLPEERKTITGPDMFIDPSDEVLVQMKSGFMKVSRYWGSRERYKNRPWIDLSYPTTDEVIAWMPLPERYRDGDTE